VTKSYLAVPAAFDAAECDAIIALAGAMEAAPVYGGGERQIDPAVRNVRSRLIARAEAGWLFERLDALLALGGAEFGLPVGPIAEQIQLLRYDEGGHFALWHTDGGTDADRQRLVSLSIELSEREDYEGGELETVPDLIGRTRTLPRGSAQLFPSRALHRVTPVTRGTRWALVAWTGGP